MRLWGHRCLFLHCRGHEVWLQLPLSVYILASMRHRSADRKCVPPSTQSAGAHQSCAWVQVPFAQPGMRASSTASRLTGWCPRSLALCLCLANVSHKLLQQAADYRISLSPGSALFGRGRARPSAAAAQGRASARGRDGPRRLAHARRSDCARGVARLGAHARQRLRPSRQWRVGI